MSAKSFCVTDGVVRYAAAWRRAAKVSRLPSVIIFSAIGRAAFARVSVVVIRPCSRRFVTRLRSVARRCHGLRPSFDPDLRCRILLFLFRGGLKRALILGCFTVRATQRLPTAFGSIVFALYPAFWEANA